MKSTRKEKKAAQEVRVAEGIVAGESISGIARAEGVTRQWLSEIANSPEVRQRIAHLVDARAGRLDGLFDTCLDVIEAALQARDHKNAVVIKGEDGEKHVIRTYPDHYARLAGVRRLQDLLTVGRPPARQADEKKERLYTIEEIAAALAAQKEQKTA